MGFGWGTVYACLLYMIRLLVHLGQAFHGFKKISVTLLLAKCMRRISQCDIEILESEPDSMFKEQNKELTVGYTSHQAHLSYQLMPLNPL